MQIENFGRNQEKNMTIIYALIMVCVLIFLHELGHFAAAKACGVKVNEFALGMGPAIYQRKKGETTYSLRIIPMGGYCAMEGEDEESTDERAFNNQPALQKAIILVAGPAMNVLTAVILMIIVAFSAGVPTTTVGHVVEHSPAEAAGIIAKDKIVRVDDTAIDDWRQFTKYIDNKNKGDVVTINVERDGKDISIPVKIATQETGDKFIGVNAYSEKHKASALIEGPRATWDMTKDMFSILKKLVVGDVSAKELSGPVGIVYMVDKSVAAGIITFIYFMALISLNLAVVNLLPFPALDGGRLIFVIIRKVTGKAITDNMEAIVHMVGMICLLALMLYVTWQDILRFIVPLFK